MLKKITFLATCLPVISGCFKPADFGNANFIGSAGVGDSVHAVINKNQFKLQLEGMRGGIISRGTLHAMPKVKNFYTIKEDPGLKIAIMPEDLIVFRSDNIFGKFGVALKSGEKPYQIADAAGIYNIVTKYLSEKIITKLSFGTFELGADYTWRVWKFRDGAHDNSKPWGGGSWSDNGKGNIIAFLNNNRPFAKLTLSKESGADLMVAEFLLKDGIALGMKQKPLTRGSAEGDYNILSSSINRLTKVRVSNDSMVLKNKTFAIHYNEPWEGFIKDNKGEFLGIISPKGIFFGINIGAVSGAQALFVALRDL